MKRKLHYPRIINFFAFLFVAIALFYIFNNHPNITRGVKNNLHDKGFVVEEIHINQLSFLTFQEIIDQLNFSNGDPIFDVDLASNQKILKDNFWINNAAIKIIFPNIVKITIDEKEPEYVLLKDKRHYAVDRAGEIIKELAQDELVRFSDFIIVTGENVQNFVANLHSFINLNSEIYNYVSIAKWVGNRRWDIKFINDLEVKLSEQDPLYSWQTFEKLNGELNFFDNKFNSVDLRVKDRVFIGLDLNNNINRKILAK